MTQEMGGFEMDRITELKEGAEPTEHEEFLVEMGGTEMLESRDFAAHTGRPIIRYGNPDKDHALILCPHGHVVGVVEIGSFIEMAYRLDGKTVTCTGTVLEHDVPMHLSEIPGSWRDEIGHI